MSFLPWPSEEKFLERVLRDCEDELAFSLCRVDPVELCENFFEQSVISRESYNHFTSMDHSRIKSRLQVRYLVRLVSEKIKKDPALWENLIAVLDTLEGVPSSLTDKLKQAVLNAKVGLADDSEVVGGVSGASLGEASENEKVVLTTGDVNFLTELLVEVSDVWFDIAISLGLLQHEIKNCKGEDNKISLFQILGFWIANNSEPTLKKLTDTLCSEIVARTAAAEKITRKFMEAKRTPRIVSQSLPTEVADGKSTLLQFQASPRESVFYQWKKDGQPLANSSRYSGVDEDILVVRHACQGTEGEYTCQVSLQDKQMSSAPITLTVLFSLAKRRLLAMYSDLNYFTMEHTWPPLFAKSFINLTLLKCRHSITRDYAVHGDADDIIAVNEIVFYNDVFNECKSEELILVLGRPGSGKSALARKVVRDWGLGWVLAKSELTFLISLNLLNEVDNSLSVIVQEHFGFNDKESKDVIVDIESNHGKGICFVLDGLDQYCSLHKGNSFVLKLLHRKLLHRSTIIVFSRPSATVALERELITKCIEVFGFRKEQIFEYVDNFPFEIEDSSSDDSFISASHLKEYLDSHPNIHDMCYLPIHAAMICFLFQFSNKLSPTQTRVYEEFTRCIIYRCLTAQEDCQALESLKDLKGAHAQYFKDLCYLAYEMTIKSIQVISSQELEDWLGGRGSLSEEAGLGLLTICPTLWKTGIYQNYAFLHLTFQEFLAAYYIANYLDDSQQIQLLQQHPHSHMNALWRFYSGLVDFVNSKDKLHGLFQRVRYVEASELFMCALESQQKCVCDELVSSYSKKLRVDDKSLTPSYLLAVEYVLKTSSQPFTHLEIKCHDNDLVARLLMMIATIHCYFLQHISIGRRSGVFLNHTTDISLNDDGSSFFCELLQQCSERMETLCLNIYHTLSRNATELANVINDCRGLSQLNIFYGGTPECIQTLLSSLDPSITRWTLSLKELDTDSFRALGVRLRNLKTKHLSLRLYSSDISEGSIAGLLDTQPNAASLSLKLAYSNIDKFGLINLSKKLKDIPLHSLNLLRNQDIGSDSISALVCGLESAIGLKVLKLSHNNIDPIGASSLTSGLKFITALEVLNLSHNNIGFVGASALANGLRFTTALQVLNLSHGNIGSGGATALADGLKFTIALMVLDLSYNNIGPGGVSSLASGLKLTTLKVLNLSCNNIQPGGATALASGLEFMAALQVLNLSNNKIGSIGVSALAGGLRYTSKLKKLQLSDNNIGCDGVVCLAGGLLHLTELRRCDIRDNKVDFVGAKAVVNSLKKCEHLEVVIIKGRGKLLDGCIIIRGLVSPDDTVAIAQLNEAAKHEFQQRTLDLGFQKIIVFPSSDSVHISPRTLNPVSPTRISPENILVPTQETDKSSNYQFVPSI